jgi:catechol 2,3-dioxygenase-like lactoylglutathione lyase family enzyme
MVGRLLGGGSVPSFTHAVRWVSSARMVQLCGFGFGCCWQARNGSTRDIQRAIEFYIQQLGFELAFGDDADPPNYVGFRRDAVELHMQFQFEHEMGTIRLRFLVEDPDAIFNEYRQRGVECTPNSVHDTPWGTREFALYDLDRNALTFYRDLTSAEKGRHSL